MSLNEMSFFPLDNPVLVFSLLLFIILVTPYIFRKIKIPHIVGLIIAGSLIGENGIHLMERESIQLYGTVGLLYIMFLAGLEIDMADFKKNKNKSFIFGMYTFLIPMTLGILSSYYILGLNLLTSVLIASCYASHTLVTYPIITKYGVTKNRSVNVAVGGTVVTDVLALLVLAVIVAINGGDLSLEFWVNLIIRFSVFVTIVTYVFPMLARWFLKRESDHISQYLFVLGLVFLAGFLSEISYVEAIIGAFLTGLALNQLIPATSALKNRIEFIGHAIFIPIFLIGVGMLINFRAFFTDTFTIMVAITMVIVATIAKFSAAFLAQKSFKYSKNEKYIIFGLSNSQAAATLAAILVGYRIGMIDVSIINGATLMILVTCTIASFATEKGASGLAVLDNKSEKDEELDNVPERILIPISHPDTYEELINLGLILKNKKYKNNIYAVNIINSQENNQEQETKSRDLLQKASKLVAATDQSLHDILRYDININHGIFNTAKEKKITDIIIGIHHKAGLTDTFLGKLTEGLLAESVANTYIYHSVQPFNTIKRMIIMIPSKAEEEIGFQDFLKKIWNMAENTSLKFIIYASETVNEIFSLNKGSHSIDLEMINFTDWNDFLIVSGKLDMNSGLMVFMSRPGTISRNDAMDKITKYLNKYFNKHNYILYFPIQEIVIRDKKRK
ncbi:MAG: cation:proton antiporter [Candidatus Cloacimonetes bacterium]|nr:cation:proton antiporter [Candidatus Cloacimonadota bacterium]